MSVIRISPECATLGLRVGAVIFRDLPISTASTELREQIAMTAARIHSEYSSPAAIRNMPEVAQHHEILRAVGVNPRSHPPSTQKLLEYARKKSTLPVINNLVDAYNLVSIETGCSLGAHDIDCIELPVELRTLCGDKTFIPLGHKEPQTVAEGEFGYVDARGRVLCRLDTQQAEFSKVTAETTDAILIVEGTTALGDDEMQKAVDTARKTVQHYCGGLVDSVTYPD